MIEDKIYYTSVFVWLSIIILFVLISAVTGLPAADVYLGRFIIINAIGSLIFLFVYELMYSLNFDFKNDNNFTKKDLTFLFLLIFGPFGLLPRSFLYCLPAAINRRENSTSWLRSTTATCAKKRYSTI